MFTKRRTLSTLMVLSLNVWFPNQNHNLLWPREAHENHKATSIMLHTLQDVFISNYYKYIRYNIIIVRRLLTIWGMTSIIISSGQTLGFLGRHNPSSFGTTQAFWQNSAWVGHSPGIVTAMYTSKVHFYIYIGSVMLDHLSKVGTKDFVTGSLLLAPTLTHI